MEEKHLEQGGAVRLDEEDSHLSESREADADWVPNEKG